MVFVKSNVYDVIEKTFSWRDGDGQMLPVFQLLMCKVSKVK